MAKFVCSNCLQSVPNPYARWYERLEFVRTDMKKRAATVQLRRLCTECMEKTVAKHRPPPQSQQPHLL